MTTKKLIKFQKKYEKSIIEYVYSEKDGDCIGYIWIDGDGDYLYKPYYFFLSRRMGKGKAMKEIAERLIQLNYKQKK